MERRFVLFLLLSCIILWLYLPKPQPRPKAPPDQQKQEVEDGAVDNGDGDNGDVEGAEPDNAEVAPQPDEPAEGPPDIDETEIAPQWVTLGSADPAEPYRMLVTIKNQGAAVSRIELNSPRYHELEERWGYLGNVVTVDSVDGKGCVVQVVGPGTPAALAGLKAGDVIEEIDTDPKRANKDSRHEITSGADLETFLKETKPDRNITLSVVRNGEKKTLSARLGWKPLEVVQPEYPEDPEDKKGKKGKKDPKDRDPLSFLMTLHQIDEQKLEDQAEAEDINLELEGVKLRDGLWQVVEAETDQEQATFRKTLPKWGLEVTKTYRLAKVPTEKISDVNYKAYHLEFALKIRNVGEKARKVAYQLDGATGLPVEGWWYSYKINRGWGSIGVRDVIVSEDHGTVRLIGCPAIADDEFGPPELKKTIDFVGVDAVYFSAVFIPQAKDGKNTELQLAQWEAIRVGEINKKRKNLTDVTCRLVGKAEELAPGESFTQKFRIFAGPKKPDIVDQYGLGELVYYGWFRVIAKPMSTILHFFYSFLNNYGLAIILLTVLVRLSMFPLSKKQVLGAQKMQELQPQIKKLQEKYKKDMEARTKAQQELFRKHNYNPLSGCLVLFVQLPIFIALYRSLMVDIELRQAPLLWEGIRWCSDLSAPDMLYKWVWMPDWVNDASGIFGLGPYFNILPVITVVLFVLQQKMFMPPPTDEQSAMQQKIMKYMMIFIGFLFFKVASGLCIYFIASSLWGLAERQLLPKPAKKPAQTQTPSRADAKARERRLTDDSRRNPAGQKSKKGKKGGGKR